MFDFADIAVFNSLVLLWGASHILGRSQNPLALTVSHVAPPRNSAPKKLIHNVEFSCTDKRMAEQFVANMILYGYRPHIRSSITGSLWLVSLQKTQNVDKEFVRAIKPFMTTLAKNSKGKIADNIETA